MDDNATPASLPCSPSDITAVPPPSTLGPVLDVLADRARGDCTRRTYRSACTHFCQWGASPGLELVAMYVVRRADDGRAVSSIRVALGAIRTAHQLAAFGLDSARRGFE